MKPVTRDEIVDYVTYQDSREAMRHRVMEIKKPRRIHLGEHLTFLFENRNTIRYQIQEMMRVEHIVREKEIQHEIDTYNELLGGENELGATLLIEIADATQRDRYLRLWRDLMQHIFVGFEDGSRTPVIYDERQMDEQRLSSVQYIKFKTGGRLPVSLVADHPDYQAEYALTQSQKQALAEDLGITL